MLFRSGASSLPRPDESRTNSCAGFPFPDQRLPLLILRARVAASIGLPLAALEESAILHYAPGQTFAPHFDFLDPSSPVHATAIQTEGQRVLTVLIYLNDGYDGGETDFCDIGFAFKGRRGDALMFWNVHPDGHPDSLTRHAGRPPTRGEKWLFSQWIRCRVG